MKTLLFIFSLLTIIGLFQAQAQKTDRNFAIKDTLQFNKILSRSLGASLRASSADTACIQGQSYCKFRLDATGRPVEVSCDRLTPEYIKAALKNAISQTSALWIAEMKNNKPVKSKVVVQPFYYEINNGCKNGTVMKRKKESQSTSGLIAFEDGDYNLNDCLILPTVTQLQAVR